MHRNIVRIGIASSVFVALGVSLASSVVTAGCGQICDRNPDEPPVPYDRGTVNNPGTPYASYETSGYPGPYLAFPPGRTYRIYHHLGACPRGIEADFAFDVSPVPGSNAGKEPSGSAPAAGNQFTKERVTPESLDVRNDTCSDVLLRVYAWDPDFTGAACSPLGEDAGNARPFPTTKDAAAPRPPDAAP
ncbi:MAG TPA: hypothetical protein VHC69_32760 [Polyangiaceae bacterium]|nr:hypothetical protein [Polyangiaceae bacterium]